MNRYRKMWERLVEVHWHGDEDALKDWLVHIGRMASDPFPQNGAWSSWEPSYTLPPYARESLRKYRRKEGE